MAGCGNVIHVQAPLPTVHSFAHSSLPARACPSPPETRGTQWGSLGVVVPVPGEAVVVAQPAVGAGRLLLGTPRPSESRRREARFLPPPPVQSRMRQPAGPRRGPRPRSGAGALK